MTEIDETMLKHLPRAVWEGELDIAGYKLKAIVLDSGQRIFDSESLEGFFLALPNLKMTSADVERFKQFISGVAEVPQ